MYCKLFFTPLFHLTDDVLLKIVLQIYTLNTKIYDLITFLGSTRQVHNSMFNLVIDSTLLKY